MTETQKANYNEFIVPIVDRNFTQQPSAGPAFAQMTYQLYDEVAANTARRPELRRTNLPLLLIWGNAYTYLHFSVAEYLKSQARNATVHADGFCGCRKREWHESEGCFGERCCHHRERLRGQDREADHPRS